MAPHNSSRIFITGASGFVGSNVLDQLPNASFVAMTRSDDAHLARRPNVTVVRGDVADRESLRGAMEGCSAVIHLAGIIEEADGQTFDAVIRQGTANVVAEAVAAGIDRLVNMSALGARNDPGFPYLQAKWNAEQSVMAFGGNYTIFRPSVIFGDGDGFISTLAGVVTAFPLVPVIGDGLTSFQPVHVTEVARCFARAVEDPDTTTRSSFELGGGKVYTYEEILDVIQQALGTSKRKVHVPVGLMKATLRLTSPLPAALRPPVTSEQLKMLSLENTTDHSSTKHLIGTTPVALEDAIDYIR